MRILITGAAGMLGLDVVRGCGAGHDAVALSRAELDITDADAVARGGRPAARPDVVVNCAAWTDVDGAESSPEDALAANGAGAGLVAARGGGGRSVDDPHLDRLRVRRVRKRRPTVESDPTGPLSAYGRSKLAGEQAVAAEAPEAHTIVRSSWLFGTAGPCFPATMLRLAEERDSLTVVDDQVGCPTFTAHLARGSGRPRASAASPPGVVHVAGGGECSWFEFAGGRSSRRPASSTARCSRARPTSLARPAPRPGVQRDAHRARRSGSGAAGLAGRAVARSWRPASPRDGTMKLLVCGGAGFIGSNFVRIRLRDHGDEVTVLDKLTYAGRRENLRDVSDEIRFVHGAIEDPQAVADAVAGCDAIVNFAAETHVDRSISGAEAFIATNMQGTHVLLEAAREREIRHLRVSTDEVYGSIDSGSFTEQSPLQPSSPYSATKTGADLLVASYFHTYGLETVICRGSNNYGPRQYPEKLIPLMILNALAGDSLPVYGDGLNVRNWLYVEDFGRGIGRVLEHGEPGEVYNCGGPDECENVEVVKRIVALTGADESQIEYVTDRPGHDRRYSLSCAKLQALGWQAQTRFDDGLARTVEWYRDNPSWWEPIRSGMYREYYERQYGRGAQGVASCPDG